MFDPRFNGAVNGEEKPATGVRRAMRPAAASLLEDLAPGATLIADRAYDTNAIRKLAAERGAWANIPPRTSRKGSFAFSGWVYRRVP